MKGHIIVATDGSVAANGALRIAQLLQQRLETKVEVVTVWEPIPISGIGTGEIVGSAHLEWDRVAESALRQRVLEQLADLGLADAAWSVTLERGPAAPTIVRLASERNAPLIVLGLGQHELVDRWLGSETALQVMRLAHVPVLAVPAEHSRLPRTAVVAMDFSTFSREAALALMDLLEPGGDVHLVHVIWRPSVEAPWAGDRDWVDGRRETAAVELGRLADLLKESTGATVHTHLVEGEAAREVLRLARKVGADLIASGSHGAGFLDRILMGSVSTRLVRGATCAVLVSPPRSIAAEIADPARLAEAS
jgi:nucleotide-binding universal stress UspA family protein